MASAPRDANRNPVLLGTLNTDGVTPQIIYVNPSSHYLKTLSGTTGTDYTTKTTSQRDDNRVPSIWGVSSADGVTPVYIAVDSSGNLLTKPT